MVEETMHIPMYLSGKGIPAGKKTAEPVANIDLAPTFSEICGVPFDLGDGESLVPLLRGAQLSRHGLMTEHYGLHVHVPQRAWYQGDWKLILQADGFAELYDLAEDPAEMANRAHEPALRARILSMHRNLVAEMDRTGDTDPLVSAIRAFRP